MKLMSYNCRGLAGPHKKSAFRRVLTLEHPDVILLQETLGVGDVIKNSLESWLPGWSFLTLDVKGRSGGLAVGWKNSCLKLVDSWGMDSVLCVDLMSADLGFTIKVINVYGPYHNRVPFWDELTGNPLLSGDSLVIGGDLNFSLGQNEVWGPHAHVDSLAGYFVQKLAAKGWLDIDPIKLKPTWKNNRCGESRVAKRIDRFLVAEQMVDRFFQVRQWVGSGGISDHFPIFFEIQKGPTNPPSPLKFNKGWLLDETFKNLLLENWTLYDRDLDRTAAFQFADNFKKLKRLIKEWSIAKKRREEEELKQVEEDLLRIYESDGGGLISQESKEALARLESRRNTLLSDKEETWRLKSRAIWMTCGDDNTKFFHAYARGRKATNTIWSLKDEEGVSHSNFEDKARCGVTHFQNLFRAPQQANIAEVIRVAQMFPRFVDEDDNRDLMKAISEEELKEVLGSFQKDKSPGPDGWTIEFFLDLYEFLGSDLMAVIEDSRVTGRLPASFNSTFIALIPKSDNAETLNEFRPISLCNCIYKIISKVIARRLKKNLSNNISAEQFGFLEGRQIHEAIGVAQEGLHSLKTKKLKGAVLKIDLSKAYDKVSWLFLRLLLTHLGFGIDFIRWVMSCITTVSFSVLINGAASPFFHAERGLRQGCPLSPLLFLLVAEGLSRAIIKAKGEGLFQGIQVAPNLNISHLLFVDDVLIFCSGSRGDTRVLKEILDLFSKATGMEINAGKSTLSTHLLRPEEVASLTNSFPFITTGLDAGLKYLGFSLKANQYLKRDWVWLIGKVEKRLKVWSHKWLSRAGRLVLVKSVLEAIPVFWLSLAWIPKGTLESIRRICFRFLWSGKKDVQVTPWVNWKRIAIPKGLGGWGLKNIFLFSKALAAKGGWRLLKTDSLWSRVIKQKYLAEEGIEDWIRNPRKSHVGGSMIWKAVVKSFQLIESKLAWNVGNGQKLLVGRDPWMGCTYDHTLPGFVVEALRRRGIVSLSQLAVPRPDGLWFQRWRRADSLGLSDQEKDYVEAYIRNLVQSNIMLNDEEDSLVWEEDPGGKYTPKAGYIVLSSEEVQREQVWWWKSLWKLECPAKSKLFMWCALENKAPTWDILQKRSFQGPGWCVLCKRASESIDHLFLSCSFTVEVWKECSVLVGSPCLWTGASIGAAWEDWWGRTTVKKLKYLPLIVIWGIWLARNNAIFNDKPCLPEITAVQSVGIFKSLPEHLRAAKQRRVLEVEIDQSRPWAFFDGASQNNVCGGGAVLYLTASHYFTLSMGLGAGTNNYAELQSLKLLLIFALEKGCSTLSCFGDSMNVVNWVNRTQDCRNLRLGNLLSEIRLILLRYDNCICRHVYRENNQAADRASKEGIPKAFGTWHVTEVTDGRTHGYFHRPFIEDL